MSKDELLSYFSARENNVPYSEIYKKYTEVHGPYCRIRSTDSFAATLRVLSKKYAVDNTILDAANLTYKFTPYRATVQVDAKGNIERAWIKENSNEIKYDELIDTIKKNTSPVDIDIPNTDALDRKVMLEIPLFDMHYGIMNNEKYIDQIIRLDRIIKSCHRDEINIIVGQDLFHNDNFDGKTANGTDVDKIDLSAAWEDAKKFYYNLIVNSLTYSNHVNVYYSKGNHDRSLSWAFVQLLKEMFPKSKYNIDFDDSMKARKCIHWEHCFIGFGHCDYKKSSFTNLFSQFIAEFAVQYADSSVREIHAGHDHHEEGMDIGGMIRRLPTAKEPDQWSDDNGYITSHKRFMLFEYEPGFLSDIHYI